MSLQRSYLILFSVQARDGDLRCSSDENHPLKLVSKSGPIQLASSEGINLNSESLQLSAKEIYIPFGVEFFDSELTVDSSDDEQENSSSDPQQQQQLDLEGNTMKAYNLMLLDNGLLMASWSA